MTVEKKKISSTLGQLEIIKYHHYIRNMKHGYTISPLLQSHVFEFGSDQPFGRGIELVRTLLPAATTGASQSQRLMCRTSGTWKKWNKSYKLLALR
jgi:hypothetical protein